MSEIGTLSLERLNNGAHFLFISNVLARAEADANVKSKLSAQIVSLKAAMEQEDEDLKISQKSMLTDDIATADAERDGLYSGYKKAVNGFRNLPVENMAKAAKVLTQHIKDYAIDPKMQLDKETGLLMNFIDDLEKKYSSEVQTLSLGAFVTALKVANEKVRTLTATHTDERMAKAVIALNGIFITMILRNRLRYGIMASAVKHNIGLDSKASIESAAKSFLSGMSWKGFTDFKQECVTSWTKLFATNEVQFTDNAIDNFLAFVDHMSCSADTYVSLGGFNGCADQLTNWDGTQKVGLGAVLRKKQETSHYKLK